MRRTLLAAALLAALAGCGDDDAPETVTVERTVTTAAPPEPEPDPDPGPTATVPAPSDSKPARCGIEGLDVPGLINLAVEGVECAEGESVLGAWLEGGCGSEQDSRCSPLTGYRCVQRRFAGSRSDVKCRNGDFGVVRFSFE